MCQFVHDVFVYVCDDTKWEIYFPTIDLLKWFCHKLNYKWWIGVSMDASLSLSHSHSHTHLTPWLELWMSSWASTSLIKIVNTFCIKETDLDFKFYFVMLSAMVILFRSLSATHWLKQNGKRRKLLWKCRHIRRITKLRVYACVCVCECECVDVLVKWHVFKSVDVIYSILLHRTYRTNHFDFISLHCIQSQSRSLSFSLSSHLLNFHSFILCSLPIETRLIMCWKAPHTQIHCGLFTFLHQTHTAHRIYYSMIKMNGSTKRNRGISKRREKTHSQM